MPEARAPASAAPPSAASGAPGDDGSLRELAEVRELLFGPERRELEALRSRVDGVELTPEVLAEHLPRAIAARSARDRELAVALAPTVERAIGESVRRNPREIATAIFPVLGPAIRKAVAETMAGLVEAINRAVEHSLSPRGLRWRIEAWRTGVPFAQVVIRHTLVYRVEQLFLVHSGTGLLLAHVPDEHGEDATLVSGMLTAIRDFVADSFRSRDAGELRTFSVGDLCVLTEPGPQAYLAAVVRGQHSPELVARLQGTLEEIHLRWWDALRAFDGDSAPFDGTRPLLEECLETVLAEDARAARRGLARFAWALPLLVLAVAIGWPLLRSHQRWRAAVARLEAEPGIVVVDAERDWGRWRFAGLRDPLARNPAALLAAMGVDTARVRARWEPFVSTEPPLALARAARVLAPPPTVALRLAHDTLVAAGAAPAAWIARAASLAPVIPGIAHVALGGVGDRLPAEVEALRREVEGRRVLFAVGSAALDPAAREAVAAVATTLVRLRREADARGYEVALRLVGRSDPTGDEASNQDLSRRRIDAVWSALVALGGGTVAGVDALGATSPLPHPDVDERARINRSVSFAVEARARDGGR